MYPQLLHLSPSRRDPCPFIPMTQGNQAASFCASPIWMLCLQTQLPHSLLEGAAIPSSSSLCSQYWGNYTQNLVAGVVTPLCRQDRQCIGNKALIIFILFTSGAYGDKCCEETKCERGRQRVVLKCSVLVRSAPP